MFQLTVTGSQASRVLSDPKRYWYSRAWEGRCHHSCFANEKTDFLGLSGLFKVMMMEPDPKSRSSDKCHRPDSLPTGSIHLKLLCSF